jgi:hypothetical protein
LYFEFLSFEFVSCFGFIRSDLSVKKGDRKMWQRTRILNVGLLVVALILSAALLTGVKKKAALGQVAQAGTVIVVAGQPTSGTLEQPLYVLDTTTQTLLVYVYQPQQNYYQLMAARKVLDDLQLPEYGIKGYTVDYIKKELDKMRKR